MLAVVVLQLALPAVMLSVRWATEGSWPATELPASFQMYSAVVPAYAYTGVDAAGRERALDPRVLAAVVRAVGTGRVVPDRFCARYPELVTVRRSGGLQPGQWRC